MKTMKIDNDNNYISTPRTKKSTAPGAGRRLAQLKISDEK